MKSRQMLWISISSLADSKPSVPGCSVLSLVSSLPSPMVTSCSSCLIHLKEVGGAEMRTLPCVMTLLKVDHSDVIVVTIVYLTIKGRASICGGGEVVFNTTHPNYFNSLLVENLWMCNNVSHSLFTFMQFCVSNHFDKFQVKPVHIFPSVPVTLKHFDM